MESDQAKQRLLAYEETVRGSHSIFKGGLLEDEACALVVRCGNAFLFGLLADASVRAETAWSLPHRLRQRLGHLDMAKIAAMETEDLADALRAKPALHRYPGNMAKYLRAAAELLIEKYGADASNIWSDGSSAARIVSRLEAFKGISRKKAALGALLLVRDLGVDVADKESIDVVYDIHIRRVCLRAGFCQSDTIEEVTLAAKRICPEFPGLLTTPLWAIGRAFCRPAQPLCADCPLYGVCARRMK